MSITVKQLNDICQHLAGLVPSAVRALPVHTTYGPHEEPVEVVRDEHGVDHVRAFGRTWTPAEADAMARRLADASYVAAFHNSGALREVAR